MSVKSAGLADAAHSGIVDLGTRAAQWRQLRVLCRDEGDCPAVVFPALEWQEVGGGEAGLIHSAENGK